MFKDFQIKLVKYLVLLFLFSLSNLASADSFKVWPSTGYINETRYHFEVTTTNPVPSGYYIKVSLNAGSTVRLSGSLKDWFLSTKSSKTGVFNVKYHLYQEDGTKDGKWIGDLSWSGSFSVTNRLPGFSSGVAISDVTGGFRLAWNSASGTVTRYELYRSTSSGSLGTKIYSGSNRSYDNTGLSAGTTYYYKAKACNNSGCTTGTQDYKIYTTDAPPVVTINTPGSSDNNLQASNFTLSIGVNDDIGLKAVAYAVLTSGFSSTGLSGVKNLNGISDSANFTIDVNKLDVGSYKIKVQATDTATQVSAAQWYYFQKQESVVLPTLNLLPVRESNDPDQTKAFTFEVQLTGPLPANYGVFLNFDDLQGSWFSETDDGGHIQLIHQGNNFYSLDTSLDKLGIRFFRAGIFNLNGDTDLSNDVLQAGYSATQTCTLPACLAKVPRPYNHGNPATTGSGSGLFKNVDVAKSNYHLSKVDMSVTGKGPAFAFSRAYNSKHAKSWTFVYEMKAAFVDEFNRQIAIGPREDGHIQYFFKDMVNEWHSINPGDFDRLIENTDGSFVLYTQGNRLYRFTDPESAKAGRLRSIEDRLGNALTFNYSNINNNLIGSTDANGRNYAISRDASNRIRKVTDFSGRYVTYTYDSSDMLTEVRKMRGDAFKDKYSYIYGTYLHQIIDPRNNRQLTIEYDADRWVEKLIDGNNEETGFTYGYGSNEKWGVYTGISQPTIDSLNHNRVYILDSERTQVEKMYDAKSASEALASGDITTKRSYATAKDNTRFSDLGLVTAVIDPRNNNTSIAYSNKAKGRPNSILNAENEETTATYKEDTNKINLTLLETTKQAGVATVTHYQYFTATGKAKTITDPLGAVSKRQFEEPSELLTKSTNARNYSTNYAYDVYGNTKIITDANNKQTLRDYDNLGRVTKEISPLGLVTRYTYDNHGNVLTQLEQATGINYTTRYVYDASDNLIKTTDPKGQITNYVYDKLNRKVEENYKVNNILHKRSYVYDAMDHLKSVTNERGQTSSTHYDARSQVLSKVNPLLEVTATYTYDKNGNVSTVTDAEGRTVTTTYDKANRKTRVEDEQGHYQTWTYNSAGRVQTYRDSRGKTTTYLYDAVGNLTRLTDPQNGITRSTYDGNGNVLTVTDPKGHKTTYTYDVLDRRKTTKLHNGQQWLYSYDANGNVLTETTPTGEKTINAYDALNRVIQLTEKAANNTITRQISYSYDANSNVTSESSGGNTISYNYDEINRVNSVTDQYGKTISYGYDKAGNRTTLTYPGNKTVTYSYDNADRLHSLTDWLNKTTSYTRNDAGQPTQVVNGNGTKTNYSYDTVGRLSQLNNLKANNNTISRHNLTLDAAGNITQASVNLPITPALPQSINGMTYDSNNRIISSDSNSYTHDQTGRIIEEAKDGTQTVYNFDINDHISTITRGGSILSSYGYDLNNNRISQTQNGIETRYVIDPLASLPNVVAETDALGNVDRYYIYGEGLVSQIDSNGNSHYYHYDPTGHTLSLTNASGNVTDKYAYAPYGFTTAEGSTPNPFRFVGKHGVMDDGNGLHYMRARYYKEGIKRFVSLDGLHGEMMSPQSLNRYAYVLGNPVSFVDPSGLAPEYGSWKYKLANGYITTVDTYLLKPFTQTKMECKEFSAGEKWTIGTNYELGGTIRTSLACTASGIKNITGGIGTLLSPAIIAAKSATHLYIDLGIDSVCKRKQLKQLTDLYIDTAALIISGKNAGKSISKANIKIKKLKGNKKIIKKIEYIFKKLNEFKKLKNVKVKDIENIKMLLTDATTYITDLYFDKRITCTSYGG